MRDNPELAILSLPFAVGCQYAHTPRNLDSLQRSHKPASQHHGVTAYHSLHDLQHSAFVTKWVSSRDRHTTGIVVPFGIRGLRQRRFTTVEQCHCTKGQQRCRFLYTYIHTYRCLFVLFGYLETAFISRMISVLVTGRVLSGFAWQFGCSEIKRPWAARTSQQISKGFSQGFCQVSTQGYTQGTFPFSRLLRHAEIRVGYSDPTPPGAFSKAPPKAPPKARSLLVASYDTQRYGWAILTPRHQGVFPRLHPRLHPRHVPF